MKYLVNFWDSKLKKQIELPCNSFTFSGDMLHYYLSDNNDQYNPKCLHSVHSYCVSLNEKTGLFFVFEGYQPQIKHGGNIYYEYRKVEIKPIEEPQQLKLSL